MNNINTQINNVNTGGQHISDLKSGKVNNIVRFLLGSLLFTWFMYVLQILGFALMGVGGFAVSGLINILSLPLLQLVFSIVLILVALSSWKKILMPKWVLIVGVYTIIVPFLVGEQVMITEYIIEIIGLVLSIFTYIKFTSLYTVSFGKRKTLSRYLAILLFAIIIILFSVFSSVGTYSNISDEMQSVAEKGRKAQEEINKRALNQSQTNKLQTP